MNHQDYAKLSKCKHSLRATKSMENDASRFGSQGEARGRLEGLYRIVGVVGPCPSVSVNKWGDGRHHSLFSNTTRKDDTQLDQMDRTKGEAGRQSQASPQQVFGMQEGLFVMFR